MADSAPPAPLAPAQAESAPAHQNRLALSDARRHLRKSAVKLVGYRCAPPGGRYGFLPSSTQTAVVCTARSRFSRALVGAGMLSDVVTARLPFRVAAANWV